MRPQTFFPTISIRNARHISSTTYVWDNMIVQRLTSNINYFAKANLIKEEDVALIKNDLMMLMDHLEKIAGKGKHDNTENSTT
ncbi:MAG: hypothetical protein FWD56_04885 [Bacteroidales bacterium]|nr:hypothetical protein [Bacteroidales bacterium]